MKRSFKEMTVEQLYSIRDQITFPDYQREPKLWGKKDKQLLIDSILKDIDIPKLYFNRLSKDEYEVIDGQQRLWAIWEFIGNEYGIADNGQIKKFKELDSECKTKILNYKFQITIIEKASEDDLRTLFLRLQLGLLLITGEKLKASFGKMRDFIFNTMVVHPFISTVGIPPRRFSKQTLCAQICINSFSKENKKEFSRTRYEDLEYFFRFYANPQGQDLAFFRSKTKEIVSTLDVLNIHFGERAKDLRNRSLILSIYLFVDELSLNRANRKILSKFVEFVFILIGRLREESKKGFYRKNEELYKFESFLSNAPGEKYQITNRQNQLRELFDYYLTTGKIKGDS